MTYFEDLTDYSLMERERRPGLVNIGWLDAAHTFSRGTMDEERIERIWQFCRFPIVGSRGVHECELCQNPPRSPLPVTRGAQTLHLGTAEIRVFGSGDRAYAVPDLIYHYIVEHRYCPPMEFIEAVGQCPLPESSDYRLLLTRWGIDERELLFKLSMREREAARRAGKISPTAELWHFRVRLPSGEEVIESVVTEPMSARTQRVMCSPVFVVELAAGDEIEISSRGAGYRLRNRGPNTACRIVFEESHVDEKSLFAAAQRAGGRVDGKAPFHGKIIMVVTFPSPRARDGLEQFIRETRQHYPRCGTFDLNDGPTHK